MEATGFSDSDGDSHQCTDWEIVDGATVAWRQLCASGLGAVHTHLGDGPFVNGYTHLEFDHDYALRVRLIDSGDEVSPTAERGFTTSPPSSPGGSVAWTPVRPGYVVETVADDLQLPVNVAFVPNPGSSPDSPLFYVTELYGSIKAFTRDGSESVYASGLINFNPTGNFPGSGEQGVTGIAIDPASGDVFASMLYDLDGSDATPDDHRPKVVRFHSTDGGHTAAGQTDLLKAEMQGESQGQSHQISNLTIGPDGKLYVHMGDGYTPSTALDLSSYRGKILRVNLNGTAPADNPHYDAGDGISARDYVWAYGFRNPFGGAWRAANGAHYEVENAAGANDRFARIDPSVPSVAASCAGLPTGCYGWNGNDATMVTNALYNWNPTHAPVNMAFVEHETFLGSGFPSSQWDHAFVTESGPTYASGPQSRGKRIAEFAPQPGGEIGGHPVSLMEYTGTGKGTAAGLAAGPDGLYWTELYKDQGSSSPIDAGARLLRLRYVGTSPVCGWSARALTVDLAPQQATTISRLADGTVEIDGQECGATILNLEGINVSGASRSERVTFDLADGLLAPGYLGEADQPEIEGSVNLGAGDRDVVAVEGGPGPERLALEGSHISVNDDSDADIGTRGAEKIELVGRGGADQLRGGARAELINGGDGGDLIEGNGGDDELRGGPGDDELRGGPGDDEVLARDGVTDRIACGHGFDVVRTDPKGVDLLSGCERMAGPYSCAGRRVTLAGTAAAETLIGTPGRDVVAALGGDDTIMGRAGEDLLCGGRGADLLLGGQGSDRLLGLSGPDHFRGGPGRDRCDRRPSEPARSC